MTELERIKEQWKDCTRCTLCSEGRKQVVFSDGPETARILICAEGPGETEDELGIPFTGPAGKLLEKILASANVKRSDCYLTNSVRCRPSKNRTPTMKEMNACRPLLLDEIRLIRPRVILIVGRPAAQTLVGLKGAIGPVAGTWTEVRVDSLVIPALIVYHPAAILHSQSIDYEQCQKYKRSLWESMQSLREFLDTPEVEETVPITKGQLDLL